MKKWFSIALGIVTATGGFLDAGTVATSGEAGAKFGLGLIWAMVVATAAVIVLVEMIGRFTAVSEKTYADVIREKFGFKFYLFPLTSELIAESLLLTAEIGGIAIALSLFTGISWHALFPMATLLVWLMVWRAPFSLIENGPALLGLLTLSFLVGIVALGGPPKELLQTLWKPEIPSGSLGDYLYLVAAILGATISPYLIYFYSSGAREEQWTQRDLMLNRVTAIVGMGFGSLGSIALTVLGAIVLLPLHITSNTLGELGLAMAKPLGPVGAYLFAAALFATCLGAALEVSLAVSYNIAQGFGWEWGEGKKPVQAARFNLVLLIYLLVAIAINLLNIDPLQLALLASTVIALFLPISPNGLAEAPAIHPGGEQALPRRGRDGLGPLSHQFYPLYILMKFCYTRQMNTTLSAKLKLHTTPQQFKALRQTQLAYRDALNYVSQYAFEHGKMSNKVGLQEGTYQQIRARFKLPAQMACSVPRQVGATYKTLWTKVKQNVAARKAGLTKKRYKGLDQAPKYVSPTLTYQLGHDYSFKKGQQVSLLSLDGRVVVPYSGYSKHVALLQQGASIGAAKLWYDKPRKQFYLLVSLEVETADPTPESQTSVVGVDVGMRYLAVSSSMKGEPTFHSGKSVVSKSNHYARLRKRLQQKGTRAATRRLVQVSQRERRLKQDANHVVSKRIVEEHPHALIGLENLINIRERTKRKHGKKATKKQRKANVRQSKWALAELHAMIAYKATLQGSMAVKVDAHYTSQACPMCGYTSQDNRPRKGLLFICQSCRYTLHSDLVGARNITLRTLLIRQDWMRTGVLSVRPDVSNDEAKALRLNRYSELRWSSDTSPCL